MDPTATAQHEDLFNRSRELYVTNLPVSQLPRDALQQQRAFASQGAGNTRPAAPEHNRMLNNLTAGDYRRHKEGTRLPTAAADWRKLRNHLKAVEGQPRCVCYNCGMLIYRKDARFLAKAASRDELRAWRVFRPLIEDHARRDGVPVDDLFLCEHATPAPDDGAARCHVFACGSCRSEKASDPARYDLMDGVQPDGTLEDIGLGSVLPPVLAVLNSEERLMLSVVKVIDGAYDDYAKRKAAGEAGAYGRYWGGAFLEPGNLGQLSSAYRGMSALLVRDAPNMEISEARLKAALDWLMGPHGNPLVRHVLTCYERELRDSSADPFPAEAGGGGGLPIMTWDSMGAPTADDDDETMDDAVPERPMPPRRPPRQQEPGEARSLGGRGGRLEAVTSVYETGTDAVLHANSLEQLVVGVALPREEGPPVLVAAVASEPSRSVEDGLHTALHPQGLEGWHKKPDNTSCSEQHHVKARLGSVNPRYRLAPEYLWTRFQSASKKALHAGACRLASGQLAATATYADVQGQHAELSAARRAMPQQYGAEMTTAESFTGGVAATVRGGKKYWRQAFIQASPNPNPSCHHR